MRRSTTNADADPPLTAVASDVMTRSWLAKRHRACPGLPMELSDAQPFRYHGYTFAGNGDVHPFGRVGGPPSSEWCPRLAGTIDSEQYCLAVMAEGAFAGPEMLDAFNCHDA